MKPFYVKNYVANPVVVFSELLTNVDWVNRDAPRDECFMSYIPREYTYGSKAPRTYQSVGFHYMVNYIMTRLNEEFSCEYNVCFLNRYRSQSHHLGWHADDSPEMDQQHPIASVSLGAERYIWIKEKTFKGDIPDDQKYLLENGSLFVMPPGFQDEFLHRIPKHDRPCGERISLTFRRFKVEL
jgi:alkylated DNA repair dioxygenase AlkB